MDENTVYYGFIQMSHGADHIFVYTEEQIQQEFTQRGIDLDLLPTDEENSEIDFFPIGGSNSAASVITRLEGDEDVKKYLQKKALGPDFSDPMLVDLAEYYWGLQTDEGCLQELLDRLGLDQDTLEHDAMKDINDEIDMICDTLCITRNEFYDDDFCEFRRSDVYFIKKIKDLVCKEFEENGPIDTEARISLPKELARELLDENGFYADADNADLIDKVQLVITYDEEDGVEYRFTDTDDEYNFVPCQQNGNDELAEEALQRVIEDACRIGQWQKNLKEI